MALLVKFIYFFVIWIIERINPDRKNVIFFSCKKIDVLNLVNSRFVANYFLGLAWLVFINYLGRLIYDMYNELYYFIYHSLHFQKINLLSIFVFFLIFDYSTYLWHRASHKFKFLRRFHQVHHCDLWVDFSTSFRFHFGELSMQLVFKLILVFLLRIDLVGLLIFETIILLMGVFHHSNIYLPPRVDSLISLFIVTPRYHLNHHLVELNYANSNYSSILTVWDRFHGTYTEAVRDNNRELGVVSRRDASQLNLYQLLKMPFKL